MMADYIERTEALILAMNAMRFQPTVKQSPT